MTGVSLGISSSSFLDSVSHHPFGHLPIKDEEEPGAHAAVPGQSIKGSSELRCQENYASSSSSEKWCSGYFDFNEIDQLSPSRGKHLKETTVFKCVCVSFHLQLHWSLRLFHLGPTPVVAFRPGPAELACSLLSTSGLFRKLQHT